jgi:hypothetical protein
MIPRQFNRIYISFLLYCVTLVLGAFFSYSFTDPNLVISPNPLYWEWQQWMWRTWFDAPTFQAQSFIVILVLQWSTFFVFAWSVWKKRGEVMSGNLKYFLIAVPLCLYLFSYNALSHDVFNYMFNARIVSYYHADPHTKVALDFLGDPWLRFMHNTHTPAPYGYGWTALSLIPYVLGRGLFLPTWLLFRLYSIISFVGVGVVLWKWLTLMGKHQYRWRILVVAVSPIVLSEVVMNAHNDLWMLVPALASLYILDRWRRHGGSWQALVALLLLVISIAVKLATIVLVPLFVWLVIASWTKSSRVKLTQLSSSDIAFIASILMFVPLLTARSQYFHPWYILWPLVWLPLIERKWWLAIVSGFAISSSFRYLPWIAAGGFEGNVLYHQQLITWVGGSLFALAIWLVLRLRSQSV